MAERSKALCSGTKRPRFRPRTVPRTSQFVRAQVQILPLSNFCILNTRTCFLQRYLLTNCSVDVVFFLFFFPFLLPFTRTRSSQRLRYAARRAHSFVFVAHRRSPPSGDVDASGAPVRVPKRAQVGDTRRCPPWVSLFFSSSSRFFFRFRIRARCPSEVVNNLS